ncbi:MAG: ATP-dependent 6-phosphofructokinase [Kiritimatiellae bacterium]|jgi:6-phosphofructokinase 1|nr:ATP-dependent 6-phosphofructokinase [Kiritimatiellia bacterium]NLD90462.1 ATP-dependent 6-phosphofructokinase [Lentisphaerota bacterium]HOU22280.1 ATP-dependent 6-phosphofructokinase [Kiritimatiellia bacterium]HPC20231.1 ATP-dependent 6-phosphofructokinase [Kiritimatiellia bacterium]HQN80421.1 ATP-dependent 6-phosphofructokinase [Kiritimatiellia bacterium]
MPPSVDTAIQTLGPGRFPSPLDLNTVRGDRIGNFVSEKTRVRHQVEITPGVPVDDETFFEKAGPRQKLFFEPRRTRAALVTCGGLCPGLNNVIRSAFLELHHNYGVPEVLGIRHGYQGLTFQSEPPLVLTPEMVDHIHRDGGTILSSSRGQQSVAEMVDYLTDRRIDVLLCVGGDGTQRGAHDLAQEITRRKLPIAVVGIPKTIDNDIQYVRQTFGFYSAIESARAILDGAHCESKGAPNGIGLVKLMGRDSGFIAAGAAVASQEVNFVLVPEVPLRLDGPKGFLAALHERITRRHHAVIVVAEGAGQDLLEADNGVDKSGNRKKADIGIYLRDRIAADFKDKGTEVNLKYIDPSYVIRSVPANSQDARLCDGFARHAVHAAMAGKTDLIIGDWYSVYVHVPIPLATASRKKVDPESDLWHAVIAATGQPQVWD